MSDQFSHSNGRTTRKVSAPPGGVSTISFGQDPVASPALKVPDSPAPAPEPAPAEVAVAAPVENGGAEAHAEGETLDTIKLKALAKISSIRDESPDVKQALADLIQKLDAAGVSAAQPLQADMALAKLQYALKLRGTHGIVTLGKKFRAMDDDGDNKISFDEFRKALKEMEVSLDEPDVHRLFRFFDADCSGYLSFDEFMVGLRGKLNPRRQEMVNLAFKVLDKEGAGHVTLAHIKAIYNAKMHPDVLLGVKSEDQVLLEFMEVFEAHGGGQKGDGVISPEEFNRYYGSISASVDTDDYFELVIRNAWHISGGEGWSQNTTCRRVLVLHTDGSQSVQEVKDDFHLDTKDVEVVRKALESQGVKDVAGVALYALPIESPPGNPPSTPTAAPAASLTPGQINRKHNLRSSIMFG